MSSVAPLGKGADMLIPALLPDLDVEPRKSLADTHAAIFQVIIVKAGPFPQARALLAQTRGRGQHVALTSSASPSELKRNIDLLYASDRVASSASNDQVKHRRACLAAWNSGYTIVFEGFTSDSPA